MDNAEKELLLLEVEHNIGMLKTFHKEDPVAQELIELYEAYQKEGTSTLEIKLFAEDLRRFHGKELLDAEPAKETKK